MGGRGHWAVRELSASKPPLHFKELSSLEADEWLGGHIVPPSTGPGLPNSQVGCGKVSGGKKAG